MNAQHIPIVRDGKWSCCGGLHPEHRPQCLRLRPSPGDLHQWQEGDTYPHQQAESCPCGPERFELYPTLANPNWEGCLWKHPKVGS